MPSQPSRQRFGNNSCLPSIIQKDQNPKLHHRAPYAGARKTPLYHRILQNQGCKTLKNVCKVLIDRFEGKVPATEEELLSIKGVGRKTANLVLGLAFGKPAICVDIHVHRISNRLGLVKTKTPEETEMALQKILPKKYWIEWNKLLVIWGQNVCLPISPKCSSCAVRNQCKRIGITKSR